jgi:hypothetical protein
MRPDTQVAARDAGHARQRPLDVAVQPARVPGERQRPAGLAAPDRVEVTRAEAEPCSRRQSRRPAASAQRSRGIPDTPRPRDRVAATRPAVVDRAPWLMAFVAGSCTTMAPGCAAQAGLDRCCCAGM